MRELVVGTFLTLDAGGAPRPALRPAPGLRLLDSKRSGPGVVMATYRRAGAIHYGSFAFENPTPEELARRQRLAQEGHASEEQA